MNLFFFDRIYIILKYGNVKYFKIFDCFVCFFIYMYIVIYFNNIYKLF